MKKILSGKNYWIWLLILLIGINVLAAFMHFRIDLTAEKRFSLTKPTKDLISNLDAPVTITVFLTGDMPAGFKRLSGRVSELLQEFKETGGINIQYNFKKPGDGLDENSKNLLYDSLARLGIRPYNIKAQTKEGEGNEERLIFPGALVSYKDRITGIDLLSGQNSMLDESSINRSEALLEYKLASSIHKVKQDTVPLVGYLIGNGQPMSYSADDLFRNVLQPNYPFRFFPIDSFPVIPTVFSAMIIAKPTVRFSDEQKLKIDQYIMHGGKVLWMIDNVFAEYDSLVRSQNEFIAFDRDLNIEDQLFKYGVRVNLDLVQDLNADKLPSVVGTIGGKPQMELLPWHYFPLLSAVSGHPISKNLDYVVGQFPNSIDTLQAVPVKKTVLLSTSGRSRILSSPAKVTWKSIETQEDYNSFNKTNVPVAVLLEGRFSSLFANRISSAMKDSLAALGEPFLSTTAVNNSMIVISDGDIALNAVTKNEGPLPMGVNMYSRYQYANKEFILNCLEFLTDKSNILESRAKDYSLRLLDKQKLEEERTTWQSINILLPILLIIIFGVLYQYIRKRKYGQ
jgi:gliding-associated putative ABC transporter substrate-binding component GldG